MKKLFCLLTTGLVCMSSFSQSLQLKKGMKLQVETSTATSTTVDMGGQQIETNTSSVRTQIIGVKDKTPEGYTISDSLGKMTMSMEGMGQSMTFDSDKKEDTESPIGQKFKEALGKTKVKQLDNKGKLVESKQDAGSESDDLTEMFNDNTKMGFYLVIPEGKKTGDTWAESMNREGMKGDNNYTVKSLTGNVAVIGLNGTQDIDKTITQQGMDIKVKSNMKVTGELTVDAATGIVKQSNLTINGAGTSEVMGQTMPTNTQVTMTTKVKEL